MALQYNSNDAITELLRTSVSVRYQPRRRPRAQRRLPLQAQRPRAVSTSPVSGRSPAAGTASAAPTTRCATAGWLEALGGFEYKADCWVARVVVQRFATTVDTVDHTVFFALELNGLGSIGTRPVDQLDRNIRATGDQPAAGAAPVRVRLATQPSRGDRGDRSGAERCGGSDDALPPVPARVCWDCLFVAGVSPARRATAAPAFRSAG
ncbi:MAG: hypothetical protein MZW92_11465 [Comamonadaceae bacterium]|nr:hypothetical protein [Comamonadaceae bacterium]